MLDPHAEGLGNARRAAAELAPAHHAEDAALKFADGMGQHRVGFVLRPRSVLRRGARIRTRVG